MTYGRINLGRKDSSSEVEPFLRRNPTKEEWKGEPDRDITFLLVVLSVLFFIFALAFFVDKTQLVGGIFAEAHGAEEINYQDVHSKYAFCLWYKEHPGQLTNMSPEEIKDLCK